MNYAAQNAQVIRTSKKLDTIYHPTNSQRQMREYCRSHNFSIRIDNETREPYAVATKIEENGK